jgi:hypothetical protein
MDKIYSKILVARYSPPNKCFVNEGEVLYIKPLKTVPMKLCISHHFISTVDRKTKSKYGWVKIVDEFTLSEFISNHLSDIKLTDIQHNGIELMLNSIAKLDKDIPVAATYSERGILEKRMDLTIHRMFFY